MQAVFLKVLNMSITTGWLILAILIMRIFLKKAPKSFRCILWGLVGLRLLFPFSFESQFSLIPSSETIPQDIFTDATPEIESGIKALDYAINENLIKHIIDISTVNPLELFALWGTIIWFAGVVVMICYSVVSYIKVSRKVAVSIRLEDNIYICDNIDGAFIFGIIRPQIYLPSNIDSQHIEYVVAHEKAHLERHDNIWKPIGFALLSVHWFNPFVWVAYFLLCKDIEMACDEAVIKNMNSQYKKGYSTALVDCSIQQQKMVMACPLAFGQASVKQRIKSVINYKKPGFVITITSVAVSIVLITTFMTNPIPSDKTHGLEHLESHSKTQHWNVDVHIVSMDFDEKEPYLLLLWENNSGKSIEENKDYNFYLKTQTGKENITQEKRPVFAETNTITKEVKLTRVPVPFINTMKNGTYCVESAYKFKGSNETYDVSIEFEIDDETFIKHM